MDKRISLVSLTVLSLLFSCTSPVANTIDNRIIKSSQQSYIREPITGKAEFPDFSKSKFSIKANVADIGVNATVSLITPSDHPTNPNSTVATGLTNSIGVFTINTGFTATAGDIFVLDATRRIGASGNSSMSVRTYIKWTGSSWSSITSPGVSINSKTTALVAMAGSLAPAVSADDTIGSMPSNTPSDIKHNGTGPIIINASSIVKVADLVVFALSKNQDPFYYLTYNNGKFYLKDPVAFSTFANTITTVAGNGATKFIGDSGQSTDAGLASPQRICVDSSGNVYITDTSNYRIRKVDTSGVITTVAGNGTGGFSGDNGQATSANINNPIAVSVDSSGNIYFSDGANRIRKVTVSTGVITTVAGNGSFGFSGDNGQATAAGLIADGVSVDSAGNIYIVGTNRVRKIDTSGVITTVAGNGTNGSSGDNGQATAANISPNGLSVDSSGNIYISELNIIRKVDTSGVITTVAGNGTGGFSGDNGQATAANINPNGVSVDSSGNIYIGDTSNSRIRKVTASTGVITTIAGNGTGGFSGDNGQATAANISPSGLSVDSAGNNIYIAESNSNRVRKVDTTGVITTFAGGSIGDNKPATNAGLAFPRGVSVDGSGNVYIADGSNNRIRKVTASTGVITTVAGNGISGFSGDNGPATIASLSNPNSVSIDSAGNIYISDNGNSRIRKVTASTGIITTLAGNGSFGFNGDNIQGTAASISNPSGVSVDNSGNVYIADGNNRIRKVDTSGVITTLAGNGSFGFNGDNGQATAASISNPSGVSVDSTGNVYIADGNNRIRKVDASSKVITTIAGNGSGVYSGDNGPATAAGINTKSVSVDNSGNVYIADSTNSRIRKVDTSGVITTIVGNGIGGFSGDNGSSTAAGINNPSGVIIDSSGSNIYISDANNNRIRKVELTVQVSP